MANDQTLVQIRERSYLDLLGSGCCSLFVGGRAHSGWPRPPVYAVRRAELLAASIPEIPHAIWPVLLFLEAPWATTPLTLVLGGLMFDRPPGPARSFGELSSHCPRSSWSTSCCGAS